MASHLARKLVQFNFRGCSALVPANQSRSCTNIGHPEKAEVFVRDSIRPAEKKLPETITVPGQSDVSCLSGVPKEIFKGRLVRIYLTPKNAMQSGTNNVDCWEMEFNTQARWENPLMGWASTGDPVSNIKLQFNDKEEAIRYAEKNGFQYYLEYERKDKPKVKSYGFNFSWNKRSRVSTK